MQSCQTSRQVTHLAADLDDLRTGCERLGDTFRGVAILFGAVAALVMVGGIWTSEPLFTVSSAFALTAAGAFAFGARALSLAVRASPRILASPAAFRTERKPNWSRAA